MDSDYNCFADEDCDCSACVAHLSKREAAIMQAAGFFAVFVFAFFVWQFFIR